MSRTRTLQMLLVVSATAWIMILGALGGMIAMHVFDRPHPRVAQAQHVHYEHVYVQRNVRPVLVQTPYGPRYCCPPPPCCPRSHVTYAAPTTPTPRTPWLFLFTGLLVSSAVVTSLVTSRRLAPMQL